MTKKHTNLAAKYYVLSMLHRLGVDAELIRGSTRAVEIIVENENKTKTIIHVRGLEGSYDWPAGNIQSLQEPQHFYALVSFEGKITDPQSIPTTWIIPSKELAQFIHEYNTRTDILRAIVVDKGERFLNAWSLIVEQKTG
jgi:hypothetical protein